jgi:hypothetical protein
MLYTVLGLYDPAELAIDTRLVACNHWNDEPLIPSHHGFARSRMFGAQPDAGRRVIDSEPARHGIRC